MFCQPAYHFFSTNINQNTHNYLEIGVFNGDSIAGIAQQFPDKSIFAIDPFIEDGNTMHTSNVQSGELMPTQRANTHTNINGLKNIALFEMTSKDFNDILTDEMIADMDVGWILIDGSHHYEDVILDAHMSMRIIGDRKGVIIFDDIGLPGVNQAYVEWKETYKDRIKNTADLYDHNPGFIIAHWIN